MNLQQALAERKAREIWPHRKYYWPFEEGVSNMLRHHYHSELPLPEQGDGRKLFLKSGLQLSNGYNGIIIGDYGAYVEITPEQIIHSAIKDKFGKRGTPRRPIKYWWMIPTDGSNAKIYEQVQTVSYADYLPGMFYISPDELKTR